MTLFQRIGGWWRNLPRWLKLTGMIFIGVLILARLALPTVLKTYVNHRLSLQKNYGGKVGNITVHLWRGAYRIHDIHIYKLSGKIHEPFFEAAYIDLSIQWLRLFTGGRADPGPETVRRGGRMGRPAVQPFPLRLQPFGNQRR